MKPRSHVRWWESLLIFLAATFPAMLLSGGEPPFSWRKYLAYGIAATVAVFIISGIDQRRRRRAYAEAERREPTQAPGSSCCSPRSRDA